jgi:CelD/BcsL family acetyltransferase involved in cellulose biosynthesis
VTIHSLDPIRDARWNELIERSAASSLFHSHKWLNALQLTYGYEPVVFTDAPPGQMLRNGLLCCRVNSWITGRRLVSLPFSDHCEPLVESPEALTALVGSVEPLIGSEYRYIELRPREMAPANRGFDVASEYWLHVLDLRRNLANIFDRFHESHTRRAIRRAERRGVSCDVGRSQELLRDFYTLHVMTRRRHRAPIQPVLWFQRLAAAFGNDLTVYVARHAGQLVAAILTLRHKNTLVYKYGGSNYLYKSQGGMPLLFWRAIQDAHAGGVEELDLGRSDVENLGLVAFKDHFGARRTRLCYYRCGSDASGVAAWRMGTRLAKLAYSVAPSVLQVSLSGRLYRHLA